MTRKTKEALILALQKKAARLAGRSLYAFVKQAWHVVEPGREFIDNWHIRLICDELERVARGEVTRLVICIPPGHMKSLLVSVFFPAWKWLREPWLRSQYLSGSDSVRKRDSRKTRDVIESQWYQRTLKVICEDEEREPWTLKGDQNEKLNFATSEQGVRQSMTVLGKVTGDRGDDQVLDDPYDVKEAMRGSQERIAERMEEVVSIWDTTLSSRLNDKRSGQRVVIMQRLHELDLAGQLLARDEYERVVLQSEYDPDFKYNHPDDPRTQPGELLFPELFPPSVIKEIKGELKEQWWSQHQQVPKPPSGGMYKRAWFYASDKSTRQLERVTYRVLPDVNSFDKVWQSWDFSAGSESKTASYVAGHIYGFKDGFFWLFPVEQRGQMSFTNMRQAVLDLSAVYPSVHLKIVEWKASGPDVVDALQKDEKIGGFVPFQPGAHGSKDVRADVASEIPMTGNLMVPHRGIAPWIDDWIEEMCAFPSEPDDRVDTFSQSVLWYRSHGKSSGFVPKAARRAGRTVNPFK